MEAKNRRSETGGKCFSTWLETEERTADPAWMEPLNKYRLRQDHRKWGSASLSPPPNYDDPTALLWSQ